jgi:hypothetical protein
VTRIRCGIGASLVSALLICALGIGAVVALQSPEAANSDGIYSRFREYRLALANSAANVSPFFSRRRTDEWVGLLLLREEPVRRLDTLEFVRNRFRFGETVHLVYDYTVSMPGAGKGVLTMVFRSEKGPRPMRIDVTYVMEGGQWQIDSIAFDARKEAVEGKTGRVLEEFPESR